MTEPSADRILACIDELRPFLLWVHHLEVHPFHDYLYVFLCDGMGRTFDDPMHVPEFVRLVESPVHVLMSRLNDSGRILQYIKKYKGVGEG